MAARSCSTSTSLPGCMAKEPDEEEERSSCCCSLSPKMKKVEEVDEEGGRSMDTEEEVVMTSVEVDAALTSSPSSSVTNSMVPVFGENWFSTILQTVRKQRSSQTTTLGGPVHWH